MNHTLSRRSFLTQSSAVSCGFLGLGKHLNAKSPAVDSPYGPLVSDPKGVIELPKGFSYRVISRTGEDMTDGYQVPGKPDGMGCFPMDEDRVVLVRNHEIGHEGFSQGPFKNATKLPESFDEKLCFDVGGSYQYKNKTKFAQPFVGGTTTVVYNTKTQKPEKQFLSLLGTDRNCAGGPTPWNTWITCEEPSNLVANFGRRHGYNFEVPASGKEGITKPVPLKDMGRFRHEAVAVDPDTGYVYETEDQGNGVIYRFLPNQPGNLAAGGKLQALVIDGKAGCDTRNWPLSKGKFPIKERFSVSWIDLDDVESPNDDLRIRATAKGAAVFARGEGMWFGSAKEVGEKSIFFACTNGGERLQGQIFRLYPDDDMLELYLEPNNSDLLTNADNITVSPNSGHLYICEDIKATCHIRGVDREGGIFTFAKNVEVRNGKRALSELAGACFSPDGKTLFVNIQRPGATLAITGPFV